MERLEDVLAEITEVKGVTTQILKDTIADCRADAKRKMIAMCLLIVLSISAITGMSIYNSYLLNKQAEKHQEEMLNFLGEYDFEVIGDINVDGANNSNTGDVSIK